MRDISERVETSMLSTLQWGEIGAGRGSPRVLILDEVAPGSSEIPAPLEARGYEIMAVGSGIEALQELRRNRPGLLVVAPSPGSSGPERACGPGAELRAAARELGIPVLDVVSPGDDRDAGGTLRPAEEADDWVVRGSSSEELAARVARLLRRPRTATPAPEAAPAPSTSAPLAPPIDTRFSALVVHDLRTPLNVIGLSLHLLGPVLPRDDPEIEENLLSLHENFKQIERMLSQLSDYARLFEPRLQLQVSPFDPRRLVDELLENRHARPGQRRSPVRLDVQTSCPVEAALDQGRARLAIEYALLNAGAAAQDGSIRLTLRGGPQRWIIEVSVDRPPPSSVHSVELRPQVFERLCGTAAERRGIDLAIAARVSELFGGTARLDVVAGRGSTIVLDWPARIAGPSATS
jgi:signal transduction histidine kinase